MSADASTSGGRRTDRSASHGPAADDRSLRLDDPRAIQILATEHWSLLAARALSWNESFSRTSMLLATLSATVVALALAAQVAEFGPAFVAFALVVLPFVELVGVATFARLGEANREDLQSIQGMNRIRHAYVEIAPSSSRTSWPIDTTTCPHCSRHTACGPARCRRSVGFCTTRL